MEGQKSSKAALAAFIAGLPQLTNKYKEVIPLRGDGGEGQNSLVFRAVDGRKRVILKFSGPWNDEYRRKAFERECRILKKLKGQPGIVQILGDVETIEVELTSPDGSTRLPYNLSYFAMEEAKTDVEKLIYQEEKKRSILRNLEIFRATCRAVRRLHNDKICHRDLKPQNLLVFRGVVIIKLGDFGTARELGEEVKGIYEIYDFPRGDLRYTAPELICVTRECDQGFLDGDFYSLGAILFELITGRVFSEYVYSLEYLNELAAVFKSMPTSSREYMFEKLLPTIMEAHPMPRLSDLTEDIPGSIEDKIEAMYRKLTNPRAEERTKLSFDEIFRGLEVMTRILRWEEVSGKSYRRRV